MTKTLASLALLKVTWDTYQRDFIDIFVLFIINYSKSRAQKYYDNKFRDKERSKPTIIYDL
jgi:hypothetical protein